MIAVFLVLLAIDLRQPPAAQWSAQAAVSTIHVYQATLSKWYAQIGVQCRFRPSCSHYSEECIRRFGVVRGGWMSAKRIARCGPWTPLGTVDLPPT